MNTLPFIDLLGYWIGIFLTLCILSFLYKDNPFYKFAEHLFIGVSIGYIVIQQYYNTLRPKLVEELGAGHIVALVPLALVLMLFIKAVSKRLSWMGRYPLAFVVAFYAGLQINGVTSADIGKQAERAMADPVHIKTNINHADEGELFALGLPPIVVDAIIDRRAERPFESLDEVAELPGLTPELRGDVIDSRGSLVGLDANAAVVSDQVDWFGTFSQILLFLGLIAALIYFYFSVEHKGAVGKVSRFGVWVLMVGFGAAFGFTVMGRLALMVGRVQDIRGDKLPEAVADQVQGPLVALISLVIIVAGITAWELWRKRNDGGDKPLSPGGKLDPERDVKGAGSR